MPYDTLPPPARTRCVVSDGDVAVRDAVSTRREAGGETSVQLAAVQRLRR